MPGPPAEGGSEAGNDSIEASSTASGASSEAARARRIAILATAAQHAAAPTTPAAIATLRPVPATATSTRLCVAAIESPRTRLCNRRAPTRVSAPFPARSGDDRPGRG